MIIACVRSNNHIYSYDYQGLHVKPTVGWFHPWAYKHSEYQVIFNVDIWMSCIWLFSWKETKTTKCRRKDFPQYVKECLIDAWLHRPWAAKDAITWRWSWCSSRSRLLGTRTTVVQNSQLETQNAPRHSESCLTMAASILLSTHFNPSSLWSVWPRRMARDEQV